MGRRLLRAVLVTGSLVLCTVVVGCGDDGESPAAAEVSTGVAVEVVRPIPAGRWARPVQVAGTVQPYRRTPAGFKTGGRVAEVLVEVGDLVEEGDALARLEQRDFKIAVREARAAVKAAQAGLAAAREAGFDLADRELGRVEQLVDAGGATPSLLDRAKAQQRVARAQLLEAQAGLQQARAIRDRALSAAADAVLEAPFGAVVVQKAIEKGQIIGPGTPAFVLESLDQVRVVGSVPAVDLPLVDPQASASVRVREVDDSAFEGRIRALGWAGDPATGTFPIEILVDNPDHHLRSGMAAWIELARRTEGGDGAVFLVPLPAVVSRGDQPHVFVVDGSPVGRARRVPVTLLGFERDRARVSGELDEGSQVVIKGQHDLDEGAPARLVQPAIAGDEGS